MTASTAFITERRERTFLVLAGIFLSAMTLLNVVGITRFIQFGRWRSRSVLPTRSLFSALT